MSENKTWERETDFNYSYEAEPLVLSLHKEFDNIYSILNQLNTKIGKL